MRFWIGPSSLSQTMPWCMGDSSRKSICSPQSTIDLTAHANHHGGKMKQIVGMVCYRHAMLIWSLRHASCFSKSPCLQEAPTAYLWLDWNILFFSVLSASIHLVWDRWHLPRHSMFYPKSCVSFNVQWITSLGFWCSENNGSEIKGKQSLHTAFVFLQCCINILVC
jgi:hypothetical protein